MAKLRAQPGSSTPRQRCRLHQLKRRHGWTDEELHAAIGSESTTLLSAGQASTCIRRLGGGKLPNPPGQKPAPFKGRRKQTSATRMIAPDHEEQIERLLGEYFGDQASGLAWLNKDFDASTPRDLLTAQRAGQVIHVLKDMIQRRRTRDGSAVASCDDSAGIPCDVPAASACDAALNESEPIGGHQDAVRSLSEPGSDDN